MPLEITGSAGINPRGSTVADLMRDFFAQESRVQADQGLNLRYAIRPVIRHLGDAQPSEVTQESVDAYVAARLAEGVKPATCRRELGNLRSAIRREAKRRKLPSPQPLVLPKESAPPIRVLSEAECRRLLRAAEPDLELWLFILLGLTTAARCAAILDLTWQRIDLRSRLIDLRVQSARPVRRKGRAVVPIADESALLLQRFKGRKKGRIFTYTPRKLRRHFRRAATKARLGLDVTPHTLRHTVATTLVRSVPLIMASKLLGHSSVAVTERVYVHVTVEDLRPAAAVLAGLVSYSLSRSRTRDPAL